MYSKIFLQQGIILNRRYEIIKVLKQGGFGIVYLVKDKQKSKQLVIKEQFFINHSIRNRNGGISNKKIKKSDISFDKLKDDVKREIENLKKINNRNIVKAYDFFEENNTIYSVMEYIEGVDLEEYLENNSFNEDKAMDLLEQLIDGLKEIHNKQIVHRDIKPSNIMRGKDGIYRIIDFTTSKVYSNRITTVTGIRSPIYCPPELDARQKVRIGNFSDIYSMGIILIRLFCEDKSMPNLIDRLMDNNDINFQKLIMDLDISQELKDVIVKMTHLDPQKRFQNLEEIENILFKKGKGNKMAYSEKMSSANPGCIIIMIDQSYSMEDPYGSSGEKKKDLASLAVNRVINEIVEASSDGEFIKDRCFIAVIGYGKKDTGVDLLLGDLISVIAENPIRVESIKKKIPDGAGGLVEIDEDFQVWVEPVAEWGTPMDLAFARAYQLAEDWCNEKPDSFPPLVINISDGEPNDINLARVEAEKLIKLSNNNGNVLLLNAHIADGLKDAIKLPSDGAILGDKLAKFLFDISSELPDILVSEAKKAGFNAVDGAKGMVYNADAEVLIRLLNFGSSVAR